ncbi:TolC family protein [bacterium]|nr:TolC family protein [bacterium]MBU1635901.1 TolC family protein [bacterium]
MKNPVIIYLNRIIGKILILILLLLCAALSPAAAAAENNGDLLSERTSADTPSNTLPVSLREALLTALENNPTVTIQRLQPEIAGAYAGERRADYDPNLVAAASQKQEKTQLTSERSQQYDVSLSQALPTGTVVSAGASMSGPVSGTSTDQFSGKIDLTVTQSLLQGFGTGVNLANLRKANLDVEISTEELRAVAEQVAANIEKAYWDLFLAAQEVEINEQSLELARQQLRESEERLKVGKLAALELAAVHAETSTRYEALIDARSRKEQARLQFIFLLNPDIENPWASSPLLVDEPFIPADSLDEVAGHVKLGLKFRPDLRQAQLNLEKGALDITLTRNGLLPQLDFFITLGRTTYAQSFREAAPDVNSPFYSVNGGINFALPVRNRKARAQYAQAKLSQQQKEISIDNMKRLVERDVRAAYAEVLRSKQQIEATRVTHQLQEKKWQAELEKFRVGKTTNYLVLQAQRDLTAGRIDQAGAIIIHLKALINLYLMEGTLLDRRGIKSL